jgi:hypothetical protein
MVFVNISRERFMNEIAFQLSDREFKIAGPPESEQCVAQILNRLTLGAHGSLIPQTGPICT